MYRAYLFLNPEETLSPWLPDYSKNIDIKESGIYNSGQVKDTKWYKEAERSNGKLIFHINKDSNGKNQLYIAKLISNPYTNHFNPVGVALIILYYDTFNKQLKMSQYAEPARMLLTDSGKNVIYSNTNVSNNLPNDEEVIKAVNQNKVTASCKTAEIKGNSYFVSCNQLKWGWYMISAVPCSNITSGLNSMLYPILFVILLFVILGTFFTAMAAKKISKPIIMLSNAMENLDINKGPCFGKEKIPNDEIGMLYVSFKEMVQKIQKLILDIRESHKKQLEAEYDMLQAQINPHFLYNTLNSINWMIIMRKEYDISNAVSALSSIMQYSISRKGNKAQISDELRHVEKFLDIEKLHYGNKISYSCNMDKNALDCIVPKIILQPLIENAIIHGIAKKEDKGYIKVDGEIKDDILTIKVKDNGTGTDTDKINMQLENGSAIPAKDSIGIANVHNRIRMMFGKPYGLHYDSNSYGGVTVTVTLAAIKDEMNLENREILEELWKEKNI